MNFTIDKLCNGLIPTEEQLTNLKDLVYKLNILFSVSSQEYEIVAGLITREKALTLCNNENSVLTTGKAVLLQDHDFSLSKYLLNNIELLEREGLYLRNPATTISKTMTQVINGKTYMTNYILLQTKKEDSIIFNG
jgi:hypothetical protein